MSNNRYRGLPPEIEAFQMTEARRSDNSEWPEWLNAAWQKDRGEEGSLWCESRPPKTHLYLTMMGGTEIKINWGDWLTKKDWLEEIFPLEPDVFARCYEAINE